MIFKNFLTSRALLMACTIGTGFAAVSAPVSALAQDAACDRDCLADVADELIASIVSHDAGTAPMADVYRATLNNVAAAPGMMTIWQTASHADNRFYVIDPETQQLFMAMTLYEGGYPSLLFGRIKVSASKVAEMEMFLTRSRGDAGFQYDASQLATMPEQWTAKIGAERLPSRAQLLEAGKAIFDLSHESPATAAGCQLMENGKVVEEHPEVLAAISPPGAPAPDASMLNENGTISIPCGLPPDRPTDPLARTEIVDTEQGIVVSFGTIQGYVEPYLVGDPAMSAYVPDAMLKPYLALVEKQLAEGYDKPRLQPGPASISVAQLHRVYDGKVQGMHMMQKLGPPKAVSPWTE